MHLKLLNKLFQLLSLEIFQNFCLIALSKSLPVIDIFGVLSYRQGSYLFLGDLN